VGRAQALRSFGRFGPVLPSPASSLPGEDFPKNDVEESSADDLEEQRDREKGNRTKFRLLDLAVFPVPGDRIDYVLLSVFLDIIVPEGRILLVRVPAGLLIAHPLVGGYFFPEDCSDQLERDRCDHRSFCSVPNEKKPDGLRRDKRQYEGNPQDSVPSLLCEFVEALCEFHIS